MVHGRRRAGRCTPRVLSERIVAIARRSPSPPPPPVCRELVQKLGVGFLKKLPAAESETSDFVPDDAGRHEPNAAVGRAARHDRRRLRAATVGDATHSNVPLLSDSCDINLAKKMQLKTEGTYTKINYV